MQRTMQLPEWFSGYRDGQEDIIAEIVGHYQAGTKLVVLEAPTGVGKTLIAESVRQQLNARGVYLCTTKTLQDQFVGDFPYASLIKGRSNYLPMYPTGDVTCADCDGRSCLLCDDFTSCPYTVAKKAAAESDLAVANVAYFLNEVKAKESSFAGSPFVIIDEADELESGLMRDVSISFTKQMRARLGLGLPKMKTKPEMWRLWINEALDAVKAEMRTRPPRTLAEKRWRKRLRGYDEKLTLIADDLDNWVYTGYERNRVEFKPVTVRQLGNKVLWGHGQRFLCMSATIISAEQWVSELGWDQAWAYVQAPSPFPVERRPIKVAPVTGMTRKEIESGGAFNAMGKGVKALLARHPNERVLVHTHSYTITQAMKDRLKGTGRTIHAYMSADERQGAIGSFEADPSGVLLASSLDRGYDGKDDLVRAQIICKVPFPYLGDKQVSTRTYGMPDGDLWYAVQTARSLVQMAGRGMRHKDDYCVTYVLDRSFVKFEDQWGGTLFPSFFWDAVEFDQALRFDLRKEVRSSIR